MKCGEDFFTTSGRDIATVAQEVDEFHDCRPMLGCLHVEEDTVEVEQLC